MNALLKMMAELLLDWGQEHGYGDVCLAVCAITVPLVAVGGLIGWGLKQRKVAAAIQKTHAETEKTAYEASLKLAEILEKVKAADKGLEEAGGKLNSLAIDLRNVLRRQGVEKARAIRDDMCKALSNVYFPAIEHYLETIQMLLRDRAERRERITSQVLPVLESAVVFLEVVNQQNMLDRVRSSKPYLVHHREAKGIFRRTKRDIPSWDLVNRKQLRIIRKQWGRHLRR